MKACRGIHTQKQQQKCFFDPVEEEQVLTHLQQHLWNVGLGKQDSNLSKVESRRPTSEVPTRKGKSMRLLH